MATAKVIHGLVNSKVQTRGHHSVDGNAARCPMLDKTPKSWDAIARVGARAQNQRWNRKLVSRVGGGTHHERRRPQRLPLRRRELWVDLPWRNLVVRAADRVDALVRWWHEVRGVCSTRAVYSCVCLSVCAGALTSTTTRSTTASTPTSSASPAPDEFVRGKDGGDGEA